MRVSEIRVNQIRVNQGLGVPVNLMAKIVPQRNGQILQFNCHVKTIA